MDTETFVDTMNEIMVAGVKGLVEAIEDPPGRKPSAGLLRVSAFYKKLSNEDRETFVTALGMAARGATGEFFCVLDGIMAFEDEHKGKLELYYRVGDQSVLLNGRHGPMLDEHFRAIDTPWR